MFIAAGEIPGPRPLMTALMAGVKKERERENWEHKEEEEMGTPPSSDSR